jgi:hypothetical protein
VPNGGLHFCANCPHFAAGTALCSLREVGIELPYRTTCRNFGRPGGKPRGPLYAMVGEAKGGALWHGEIPYWDGRRADTVQLATGETVVRLADAAGEVREFPSVADYLRAYAASGRES